MMYIVLTAMLALNVAAEVLEAFRLVDSSLLHTLEAVEMKNRQVYADFEQAYIENPTKVGEWKEKADLTRNASRELISYISKLKEEVVIYSGSKPVSAENPYDPEKFYYMTEGGDTLEIDKEDDLNGPSEYLITQKKASELKQKIVDYRNQMVGLIDEEDVELRETILQELETPDVPANIKAGTDKKSWESQYFEDKPLVAVLTVMSKMQIDVKNSEANVINYLYTEIDAGSFKFNKLGARVIANSNVVLQGDKYVADIFLAAEDTTQKPQIFINDRPAEVVDGKATYEVTTSQPGVFKWSGLIKYKTPAGIFKNYPFEQEYQVTQPNVTMSATKMNVFYLGLDNPFDVSGSYPKEDLIVTMTNGTVAKSGDAYLIKPTALDEQGRRTKVTVHANIEGQRRFIGETTWRVKQVPDPVAQVAGQTGGDIRKESMGIQQGVMAVLEDFDFEFKYTVTEFEIQTTDRGGYVSINKSNSNRFTPEQKSQIARVNPQGFIYITNIKAVGDDGSTRNLDPITFKIR